MEKLNSISLGKMSLGKMSLGRIGGEMVVSSGGGGPLYKRILASMPAELRTSLVCWYSPNLQGLTNAELYNSDNLYEGGLHDLSGNGHDMTLYGFDGVEGGGHVDEEGNLCFDGVNDYGKHVGLYNVDRWTDIYNANIERKNNFCLVSYAPTFTHFQGSNSSVVYETRGQSSGQSGLTVYGENLSVNGNDYVSINGSRKAITDGGARNTNGTIYLGVNSDSKGRISLFVLKAYILFNRDLTDSEIDWVKTNMLVSQEPSNRTVTLWLVDEESGSFDKFKSMKVQNGNMIGKYDEEGNLVLPVYDVDATRQTSLQWYTDAECTEEYSGEYITEDTFMYAKEEPKLQ